MKFRGKFSIYFGIIVFLSIIGFILRITNLSAPSLWVDEYMHVTRAKDYIEGLSSIYLAGSDNNGLLLTYTIALFFKLFSVDPFWARFPSVLFGAGSIYMVYLLGRKLYNNYVGLIAAFLNTFSLFLIYWSRLSRNYTIFEFSFLLLILVLFNLFEPKEIKSKLKILRIFNIDLKSLLFVLLVFILSFLSQQLTFFVFFGSAVYLGVNGIRTVLSKKNDPNKAKYIYIGIPSFVIMLLIFMPFLSNVLKGGLSFMLPEKAVEWVVPSWGRLTTLFKEKPYETFNLYKDVFLYDFKILLLVFSMGGMVIGLFKQFKSTFYIFSFLVIPFILMSFIFREPAAPRYVIFLFPLVQILIGVFFYDIYLLLSSKLSVFRKRNLLILLSIIPFLIFLTQFRFSEVRSLINEDNKLGYLVDKKLSLWAFSNYAYPCNFVLNNLQPHDLIFSTQKQSADFYLNRKDVILFRQNYYNTTKKKYERYALSIDKPRSGQSLINIETLYRFFPRGWLIADYYFDNVMTDPEVRSWVFSHMNYHPEATLDGTVMVFSWDKSVPVPSYQKIVMDLGKSIPKISSIEYNIPIHKSSQKKTFTLNIWAKNIDSYGEAAVILNEKHTIILPKNTTNKVELLKVEIEENMINDGNNLIRFFYNTKVRNDINKGFLVYSLMMKQF